MTKAPTNCFQSYFHNCSDTLQVNLHTLCNVRAVISIVCSVRCFSLVRGQSVSGQYQLARQLSRNLSRFTVRYCFFGVQFFYQVSGIERGFSSQVEPSSIVWNIENICVWVTITRFIQFGQSLNID